MPPNGLKLSWQCVASTVSFGISLHEWTQRGNVCLCQVSFDNCSHLRCFNGMNQRLGIVVDKYFLFE